MSKIIYFRGRICAPLKVVKDQRGVSGCSQCYFKTGAGQHGGCPSWGEEKQAGAGDGCLAEHHHYEMEAACAS